MDRWMGKVAVVTGASSGIGAAISQELVKAGMIVVGLARRLERVESLKEGLDKTIRHRLHAVRCDVTKEADILAAFQWIEEKLGAVHVIVNNAGVFRRTKLTNPGNTELLRGVLDTNVMGLVLCTREAFQLMKKHAVDGHVIHINSVAGHNCHFPNMNIYTGSKHAVTALTEAMRQEFRTEGTNIKVTSISPGAVQTDILNEVDLYENMPMLEPIDIAEAVLYVLKTPPRVQVHELTIKPMGEQL